MSANRQLQGTLRGHEGSISSMELFYLPTSLSYISGADHYQFLKPSLLSGDSLGIITWWDLTSKRFLARWQAHGNLDSNTPKEITSLQQLGLTWSSARDGIEIPIIDKDWFGCFLSHGKDGEINIWRLFEPISCGKYGINSQPFSSFRDLKPIFQMPVNMINFSNVTMVGNLLATPATQNSNNFDIYIIPTPADNNKIGILEGKLKRVLKDVDVSKYLDGSTPREPNKRGGFGIVMKLIWLNSSHLSVGYESGNIVVYEITPEKEEYHIRIVSVEPIHSPEPVTALYYDRTRHILLSGSSTDKLGITKLKNTSELDSTHMCRIKHRGIGDLCVSTDGIIGLVTWDGYARFYQYDRDFTDIKFAFKVKRKMPSISNTNPNDDIRQEDFLHPQKSAVVKYSRTQYNYAHLKEEDKIEYNNGMSKNLIRRRLERNFDNHWLLIGYKDGCIAVYSLGGSA